MPTTTHNPVSAVLFDLYGTLVEIEIDTARDRMWSQFSRELASVGVTIKANALRSKYHKLVDDETREHGEPFVLDSFFFHKLLDNSLSTIPERLVEFFGRRFRALTTRRIQLRPYALPLLRELRRSGCKVGLVSNTEAIVTEYDLDVLNLQHEFDTIVLSSRAGTKKPDPRIFHMVLEALGAEPATAVFVGDDYVADFQGAKRAGLLPVLIGSPRKVVQGRTRPTLKSLIAALQARGWIRHGSLRGVGSSTRRSATPRSCEF